MYASPQRRSHNLTRRLRKRAVGEAMGYDRPLIKHCPICRTTMITEQTKDIRLRNYECLWCGLTIQYTLPKDGHRPQSFLDPHGEGRGRLIWLNAGSLAVTQGDCAWPTQP